ncbi:MAG: hypothetical protein H6Q52_1643 [Deltaproteobacteria bacterium]|nr:hypothetical protein [Deltaproteobacteria bacterium]
MEKVIAGPIDSYDTQKIKAFIEKGLRETGLAIAGRVLVKPNLLSGKVPDRAVTTHPVFLEALIELLKDYSCSVYLGDSPGYESLERVLRIGQYTDILERFGVHITPFTNEIVKRIDGVSPYREFLFGEDPDRYDHVINVPKLKTHGMMGMTLAVKNTYGFIRGFAKGRWHLRAGTDKSLFASILVDIHRIAAPRVSVLDGILGMSGDGPSNGTPVDLGLIALSPSAAALDDFIEQRLCPQAFHPVTECARVNGLLEPYEVIDLGIPPVPAFFPMPRSCAADWNIPSPIKRVLRNIMVKKPKPDRRNCQLCGICAKVCPAQAIEIRNDTLQFNYSACIRCYCCQEMCPHDAIRV